MLDDRYEIPSWNNIQICREINIGLTGTYNSGGQIKYKRKLFQSRLCDYIDVSVSVKERVETTRQRTDVA